MSFLDKIVAGMKFLASHIYAALKSVFGTEQAKAISLSVLSSAKELLKTEFGQFVQQVVTELETSALGGPERLSQATTNIEHYLKQQGQALPTVWVQWAIQTVLIFIRGLVKDAAVDAPAPDAPPAPVA